VHTRQKKTLLKKAVPSTQEIKDKISKLRFNKKRLELRKIQVHARALSIDSKLEANRADMMKLTCCADLLPSSSGASSKTAATE
jgi:hypothetical protein